MFQARGHKLVTKNTATTVDFIDHRPGGRDEEGGKDALLYPGEGLRFHSTRRCLRESPPVSSVPSPGPSASDMSAMLSDQYQGCYSRNCTSGTSSTSPLSPS
uniref:Uncharacterized protein n=1 Tax=Arundo donax TaxID=35708 RepID=A0A0A9DSG1_ARUDO